MKPATQTTGFVPSLDRRVLARLRDAALAARDGRRPPLSTAELDRFATELRPGTTVGIDIRDDGRELAIAFRFDATPAPAAALRGLTPRERAVALLIAEGLTNRQIAGRLLLSVSTVKDHVHRILARLNVTSRLAVARVVLTDRDARVSGERGATTV